MDRSRNKSFIIYGGSDTGKTYFICNLLKGTPLNEIAVFCLDKIIQHSYVRIYNY